jgi:hypothetical protein
MLYGTSLRAMKLEVLYIKRVWQYDMLMIMVNLKRPGVRSASFECDKRDDIYWARKVDRAACLAVDIRRWWSSRTEAMRLSFSVLRYVEVPTDSYGRKHRSCAFQGNYRA